jgi:hypothetical protein
MRKKARMDVKTGSSRKGKDPGKGKERKQPSCETAAAGAVLCGGLTAKRSSWSMERKGKERSFTPGLQYSVQEILGNGF